MNSNCGKRMLNLLCAGAVVAGTALPLNITAFATEDRAVQTLSISFDTTQFAPIDIDDSNEFSLLSAAHSTVGLPTLEEYLDRLICPGCHWRCPLLALRCSRGRRYEQYATAQYEIMVAQATMPAQIILPQEIQESSANNEPIFTEVRASAERNGRERGREREWGRQGREAVTPQELRGTPTRINNRIGIEYLPFLGLAFGGVCLLAIFNRKKRWDKIDCNKQNKKYDREYPNEKKEKRFMKTKALKIIIDVLMVILLLMCIPSSRNGYVTQHIIEGALFTIIAAIHVFINRKWFASVGKNIWSGKVKGKIMRQYGINVILIAVWGFAIITGFLAMGFSVWGIGSFFGFIRLHGVFVRLSCMLIFVHLFQHRSQIASYIGLKRKSIRQSTV